MNSASNILRIILYWLFLSLPFLNGCEISGDVPELNYFLNREWKIEKVVVNGREETDEDLYLYRLQLKDDYTFTETSIKGNEQEGTWRLDNNATILTLEYADGSEFGFILVEIQIRNLLMRVIQSEEKIGSLDIVYHLIPVKI